MSDRVLLDFDLASCSLVYALVRIPSHLEGILDENEISLEINRWLVDKTEAEISQVCEPIYVEEFNDRIDVILLAGGFDIHEIFGSIERQIEKLRNRIFEQELYGRKDWESIREAFFPS